LVGIALEKNHLQQAVIEKKLDGIFGVTHTTPQKRSPDPTPPKKIPAM
jgi:hypothetical protein